VEELRRVAAAAAPHSGGAAEPRDDGDQAAAPIAVGISAPGPIDLRSGVILAPPNIGPGFVDVPFAGPIGEALGLPAVMERDTNVAAMGELAFGAARGVSHFLYLTVSTGIGGSIVADGRIFGGSGGYAGELGHVPVGGEESCGCGGVGHLEAVASGVGMARAGRAALAAGRSTFLATRAGIVGSNELSAKDVVEGAAAGDEGCRAIVERARDAFAAAMVGFVNTFDPELIVVGGSLARGLGDRLLEPARRAVETIALRGPRDGVRIVEAALGDDVGLIGAQPVVGTRLYSNRP
jgi:glucokinase